MTTTEGVARKCSTRLVSGVIKFQLDGDDFVTVMRKHIVFATGAAIHTGHGHLQLMLQPRRKLAPGNYTLKLKSRHGGRQILKRTRITIT